MSKFVPLSACMCPPKSKSWSCAGCKLYQYAPLHIFTKEQRKVYEATLDPERADKKNNSFKLGPDGPDDAEVMVVMEAPTRSEDDYGNAFSAGPARIVRRNAKDCGLEPDDWRWNYLIRCANPDDEEMSLVAGVYCSRYLSQDVLRVKPKVIVTFGAKATAAVLGKPGASINHFATVAQKAVVAGHECVVYPMLSPGYILRNDYLARRYLEHFKKLAAHLTGETAVLEDSSIYRIVTSPDEAIEVCQKMIAAVEAGKTIDADTETSNLNPFKLGQRLSVISLARSTKRGYAIMYNHDESAWTDADRKRVNKEGLKPLFAHPKLRVRWHNGKFDVKWIRKHLKFWPRDQIEDTMLTHYALDENVEHGLKPLALMYTDMGDYDEELDTYLATQDVPDKPRYDLVPMNLLGKYAAQDPVATRKLAVALKRESERQDEPVRALAYRVLPAISAASTRLEYNGLAIDTEFGNKVAVPYLETASKQSYDAILADPTVRKFIRDREQQERQKYIDGLKGRLDKKTNLRVKKSLADLPPIDVKRYFEFSLNSPDQLCTLLYEPEYFAHPPILSRKTGNVSTDKDAMQELIKQKSPIAKAIQEFRLDEKLVSTYARPMLAQCAEQGDNIMHPNILAHGTKTGRASTKNPNLQATPNKGASLIKRMVVSRFGNKGVIVQADYSQIELRILAAVSGDPKMIEAYATGKDLHLLTACLIFNLTEQEYHALDKATQKRYRTIAKRVNFGIAYGIGAPGIVGTLHSEGVDVEEREAQQYLDTFYRKYPRVTKWISRVEDTTHEDEFSRSLFGRRRRLLEITSEISDTVARAERQAVNHVIQSSAADFTWTSMVLMDQEIQLRAGRDPELLLPTIERREFPVDERWKDVNLVLQVHDSILVDCPVEMTSEVVDMFNRTMPNVVDLAPLVWGDWVRDRLKVMRKVATKVDVEVGPSWRDAYKVKVPSDVPKALFVANRMKAKCDTDPRYKWDEKDEEEALAAFKKEAA